MLPARVPLLACLLSASGCYAALGVEHDFAVARDLLPGMSREECLAVLAHGGRISIQRDLDLTTTGDRAAALDNQVAFTALETSEHESRRSVVRAVVVDRHWGFAGFGVFYLFLDQLDQLIGYHLDHLN